MSKLSRRSVCGVTTGDAWRYNNPDLQDSIYVPFNPESPDYDPALHHAELNRIFADGEMESSNEILKK